MINIEKAKEVFKNYTDKYDKSNPNISRKIAHSYRVAELSKTIAENLKLDEIQIQLAELIGLIHDIGRFEQVKIYNTYVDLKSIDHADLGVKILEENNFINEFCDNESYHKIILTAIQNHNKFKICSGLSEEELIQAKIIRDADKIDIFNILSFENNMGRNTALPVNKEILNALYNKQEVSKAVIKNDADEAVLELAMVYYINYEISLKILKEKDYINKIIDSSDLQEKEKIKEFLNKYLNEKILKVE